MVCYSDVLLNSFQLNVHTLEFHPQTHVTSLCTVQLTVPQINSFHLNGRILEFQELDSDKQ